MNRVLYQREIGKTRNGKPIKAWYYYFFDDQGRQIRRSCGDRKSPCFLKRDAELLLDKLKQQDLEEEIKKQESLLLTIKEIAADMFIEGKKHFTLLKERGEEITETTRKGARCNLEKHIFPRFGDYRPKDIDPAEVEDWLLSLPISNSTRNSIIKTFNDILKESLRYKHISQIPTITTFKRKSQKKDILSKDELKKLFPADKKELSLIWRQIKENGEIKEDNWRYDFMFGVMFHLAVSTGMRSGELRALQLNQIKDHGLYIDCMYNAEGQIVTHCKKGTGDNPKHRSVVLPEATYNLLQYWLKVRPETDSTLVFQYCDRPVRKEYLIERFAAGLKNAGVDVTDRKLTPHSLRYTYNTIMRNIIPGEILRLMIGHESREMTDYYTRLKMEDNYQEGMRYREQINTFWK